MGKSTENLESFRNWYQGIFANAVVTMSEVDHDLEMWRRDLGITRINQNLLEYNYRLGYFND